jgi:outer membrane lipoprotein SlyB
MSLEKEKLDMGLFKSFQWQLPVFAILAILALVGCQSTSQGGRTVTRDQAQRQMTVFQGTVLRVEDVQIQGRESGVGTVGGAVVGGIVGSTIGGGRGRTLAATGGALAGAAGGSAVEQRRTTRPALEIEVELDDGRIMVIVQEKDDDFIVGDRVRLIGATDGTFRVRQ